MFLHFGFYIMTYKKHKQHRLPGYDYSAEGEYFVTINVANRKQYLGKIEEGKMILSPLGEMVDKMWKEIPDKFPNVISKAYQIMPDHFHATVIIKPRPQKNLINQIHTVHRDFKSGITNNPMELKSITLGRIIRWFKGRVQFEAKKINPKFKWQARFHDRIIRDEKEF